MRDESDLGPGPVSVGIDASDSGGDCPVGRSSVPTQGPLEWFRGVERALFFRGEGVSMNHRPCGSWYTPTDVP